MKKTIALFVLMLVAGSAFAETVDIKVKGMVCSFCAQGLQKKFKAEPAVEEVKVTIKEKNMRLKLKEGAVLPDDKIKTIVSDAGYNVESITRK